VVDLVATDPIWSREVDAAAVELSDAAVPAIQVGRCTRDLAHWRALSTAVATHTVAAD
jgi:hypothetical protein